MSYDLKKKQTRSSRPPEAPFPEKELRVGMKGENGAEALENKPFRDLQMRGLIQNPKMAV